MKIGFFDEWTLGVVKNDTHIVDVSEVLAGVHAHGPQEMITLIIENWDKVKQPFQNLANVSQGKPLTEVRIRPPVPRPDKIVCMAVNYLEYGQRPMPHIDAFLKDSDCVIGDGDTIVLDAEAPATIFHHEAELAVVIGKDAEQKVSQADAMDYVFGYTGFIDVSARNIGPQGRTSFFQTKSWRTFGPMGPFIITKDEVPDPHNVDLAITVNDQGRQSFNTSDMAHKIPECIEFATRQFNLHAGDIISTGTNHQGLGALQDKDVLKFEVAGIGSMTLHVKDPLGREWERGIDEETAARARNATA
jgi:2-keto-4-pentenoate hydratase/2-oxohepta-3-ene-1,7-dioic acid hydratase in catechol pathway